MNDLLDEAPCGFLSFDDAGTIELANTTLARLLGYERDALIGKHVDAVFQPGTRIFYNTHFFPLLKLHGRAEEIYLTLRARSGDEVPALANASRRERGGRTLNDCVLVPMRRRRDFERELIQARRAAEEAGQAREKFLSVMSHELRSPLTAIVGFADLLARGVRGPVNERQLAAVERIAEAGRYMSTLIDDILTFAGLRRDGATMRVTDVLVADAIARAEALVVERAREQMLTLVRDDVPTELSVRTDPNRLQQILLNLLTNAVKFTPSGGTIRIGAERDAERVVVSVRDTGLGIDEEMLGQIFEPFVQVHRDADETRQQGVGLGLSISRELAREMGGELTAESKLGVGSRFVLILPAA